MLPTRLAPGASPREDLLAALRGYLEAVSADPVTWRLVLMPPEGAPPVLRERITAGRDAVVATLAEVVRPGLGSERRVAGPRSSPRARSRRSPTRPPGCCSPIPQTYPIERLVGHADWLLARLAP